MTRLLLLVPMLVPLSAFAQGADVPRQNAVQEEMQRLHQFMVSTLDAIEKGVLAPIPDLVGDVLTMCEGTEKALASGAWAPPKPGTTLKDFTRQDEAFHRELEKLAANARKNDLPATSKQYGVVLNACTACHVRFKFIAPPAAKSK